MNPDLSMICVTKQEPSAPTPNQVPVSSQEQNFPAIDARPLTTLAPANENGQIEEEKKGEKEHKKRSKNWTRIETLKLIRWRTEMEPRFSRSGRKSELWDEISEELRKEGFCRDSQQCRDKWEKLTAGYKEVRDGIRDKEDYPYYQDLVPLLSRKSQRKERIVEFNRSEDDEEDTEEAYFPARKRRKREDGSEGEQMIESVKELLESLINKQHRFFVELLDAMERKEKVRERIRQEREEKWRAEDRAQMCDFHNAMILLTKKLLESSSGSCVAAEEMANVAGTSSVTAKKRSKNWKRSEVLLLIKLRSEMENRFAKSTRRAALWDEIAGVLCGQGVKRDGKQCREKWDKLMAEFKDVADGKRDRRDSPYFAEMLGVGRSCSLEGAVKSIE